MIKFTLMLLFMVTFMAGGYAAEANLPTMSDGVLGIAFDGMISASEAFLMYMIGAIVSYRLARYVTNRQLKNFKMVDNSWHNIFMLLEIYIKSAIIPILFSIISVGILKLDKSFVLYGYCNEYIQVTTVCILLLLLIYVILLPQHEDLEVIKIGKADCIRIYNSFSRIFLSTVNLYCFLSLVNKMKGIDYQTADVVCRTLIAIHYMIEVFVLKGTAYAVSLKRKIAYVGLVAHFTRYVSKKLWAILGLSILALYGHKIYDPSPCFNSFVWHMGIIFCSLVLAHTLALIILESATKFALQMSNVAEKKWVGKIKKHIYSTANVANSVVYFSTFYCIVAYIFVDPTKLLADLTMLYTTIKAGVQVYLIFFAYRCIDLFMSCKFEKIYAEKENRFKTLRTVMPIIMQAVRLLVFAIGVLVVLANYNVDLTPVYTLIVGLGVPVSLAAKGTVTSFVKGFMMLLEDDIEVGNYIAVAGVKGIVEKVGLRTLKIREFNGTLHIIPYESVTTISNSSKDYTLHIVEAYCSNATNISDFITTLHEVNDEIVENDNVRGLLSLERDFSFLRVKEFDEFGTKITWGYATKPDVAGLFDCEFNNILRRKLTEKGIPFPRCLTRNGVNVALSVYLDNK